MDKEQIKSNPSITDGKTPDSLEAPINKEQNDAKVLHSEGQQSEPQVINGKMKEDEYSNKNIKNYLGSEKLDEKLTDDK